jgi:hypothetical protein
VSARASGLRFEQPERSLSALAAQLRDEGTVISSHVREPQVAPTLGLLAAAGPRAAQAPGDYALLVEAIREGYLLHYGEPRIVLAADHDLRLLAGDYLYAGGLERLAALGDLGAVRELSDLISLCAQLHAEPGGADAAGALWLASVVAVAAGASEAHERAKEMLREEAPEAASALRDASHRRAAQAGLESHLAAAAESIDSAAQRPTRG